MINNNESTETIVSSNVSLDCEMTGNDVQKNEESIANFPVWIIDESSFLKLYYLFVELFFQSEDTKKNTYLLSFEPEMKDNCIDFEYTVNNFENIIKYTKRISKNYWNVILEKIILMILANKTEIESSLTLNLFVFDNQKNLREKKYQINVFKEMVSSLKEKKIVISPEVLDLLIKKPSEEENQNKQENLNKINEKLSECPLIYLIKELFNQKNENIRNNISSQENELLKKNQSLTNFEILEEYFCSAFILNRVMTSFLKKKLTRIPFSYDLSLALIEEKYSLSMLIPIECDSGIKQITLTQNTLGDVGNFELGRLLFLNSSINEVDISQTKISTKNLANFIKGIDSHFVNNEDKVLKNITYFNLSSNYLDSTSGPLLAALLQKMPNLKTLILNRNKLGDASGCLFSELDKLYRLGKTELERLVMGNCNISPDSILKLAKLVKSHKCGLKSLVLNYSDFGNWEGEKFLKSMQYNKSLEELYLYCCELNGNNINNICNMINFSNINVIYFFRNKISNINNILKIIGLTEGDFSSSQNIHNYFDQSNLINMDVSHNEQLFLYNKHIKFLSDCLLKNCGLKIIDLLGIVKADFKNRESKNPVPKFVTIMNDFIDKIKEINKNKERIRIII